MDNGELGSYASWGTYTIPSETGLKQYYIKGEYTDSNFGTGKVIAPMKGTSGKDRFYVMTLENFGSNTYYWYCSATGLDNLVSTSTNDFGDGKTNTTTMVSKWNSTAYGAQNAKDMWGVIQDEVAKGWFVPSKSEWSAFGAALGITSSNKKGLGLFYWSSSQYTTNFVYEASFFDGYVGNNTVSNFNYVRLATTF